MQVLVKPKSKDIRCYKKLGIKSYLFPLKDYSVESVNYFTIRDIKEVKELYPDIHLFVSINKNIFNQELESLEKVLIELDNIGICAVFFYDQSILSFKEKLHLKFDLVWAQTHMVTNYNTCNYYYQNHVEYALLSKEITLEEMIEIKEKSPIKPIVSLITMPSVATSKRKLLSNYYQDLGKKSKPQLVIHEKVSGDDYLVEENKDAVTFYKKGILNGCEVLGKLLDYGIDYVFLNSDLIDQDIFLKAVENVTDFINQYDHLTEEEKEEFMKNQKELLGEDTGFFFKKTIYKVK